MGVANADATQAASCVQLWSRQEQHSTRGRARLLYEMLQGDVIGDLWQSDGVKDALDLCLAKGL